jgi:arabinogalactan endo-1,4-beta-galactosidase
MKKLIWIILALTILCSCKKRTTEQDNFAKGADIGWLSEMENSGVRFYANNGTSEDLISILKSKGINSIRLRIWVNPTSKWCGTEDVIKQALRAKNAGMRLMINFHFSDSWADPGQQNKPFAWRNLSFAELQNSLYNYTKDVMQQLKANDIKPEWVQIGNETNDGMLWQEGRASTNMQNFSNLLKAGYRAVKEISPTSKVIVHLSNGYDNQLYRWMFDNLKEQQVEFDVIGMSLYPNATNWKTKNIECYNNMLDMIQRYNKEIIISEIGMAVNEAENCRAFIEDLVNKTKSLPGNKGLGVFYWEPQCHNNWKGYTLGAFDNSGKPTVALDGFLK